MRHDKKAYVGLDVHKDTIAVAIVESNFDYDPFFWGTIQNNEQTIVSLQKKLL